VVLWKFGRIAPRIDDREGQLHMMVLLHCLVQFRDVSRILVGIESGISNLDGHSFQLQVEGPSYLAAPTASSESDFHFRTVLPVSA
jgi:hypothetical protein